MSAKEVVSIAKDLVFIISALITVSVAIYGIKSWNRELKGKASFDAALDLIKATYAYRDEIQKCRGTTIYKDENPEGYLPYPEDLEYVFKNRFKKVKEAGINFDSKVLAAEPFFGGNLKLKAGELNACAKKLSDSIGEHIAEQAKCTDSSLTETDSIISIKDYDHDDGFAGIVWATSDKQKYTQKLNSIVSDIENIVQPHYRKLTS